MSAFNDLLDEYIGNQDALTDIRTCVRRCWFYDFAGYPLRLWQGQGQLFTTDGNSWLGTIDANGKDHHVAPPLQDGRDGTSATYNFSLTIPDLPGQDKFELYNLLRSEQSVAVGRNLRCYLVLFKEGEALRPVTPLSFFKELVMFSPKFSERNEFLGEAVIQNYTVTVPCKDNNFGRSNVPNGTYADTVQKRRAAEKGVALDRGAEFLALLANRTYQIP